MKDSVGYKLLIVVTVVLAGMVYYKTSHAYPYFVPYHEIQRQQLLNQQTHEQNLNGDYPGGRNSSLSGYSQNYTNINNSNSNYQQQAQDQQSGGYNYGY